MSPVQRSAQLVLPIALMACLLVILIPLPPLLMDLLLAVNIGLSVVILLTTVSVETPLEFSVFPSMLLATTLGRLVLNIATTRLILTAGASAGTASAGGVIQGFGEFVAGDQLIVGVIIFAILVIIQFVVITKGATRISEVAARFALDGMPGRQMAIDADLNAGVIDNQEAQYRRDQLSRQADFYGAMDGASKFVRGDAIAGILIISINLVAGLFVGVVQEGMSLNEAVGVFSKLTIGDGLVSQLPAFLIALAAGMLISRSTQKSNLQLDVLLQIFRRPEPLFVAAGFLALLVFAKLPAVPLLLVGTVCVVAATQAGNTDRASQAAERSSQPRPASSADTKRKVKAVEDYLNVDPVEVELGVALLRLADRQRGGELMELISQVRNEVAAEIGIVLPKVRIRDNLNLDDNEYRICLFGDVVGQGAVYPMRQLALGPSAVGLEGIVVTDPVTGHDAVWMDAAKTHEAIHGGVEVLSAERALVRHLKQTVRTKSPEFLTRDAVRKLVDRVAKVAPTVVDELIPSKMKLAQIQQVLRQLVAQQISIRNLPVILETICDAAEQHACDRDGQKSLEQHCVECVRSRLAASIVAQFADPHGQISAVTVVPEIEEWLESRGAESLSVGEPKFAQLVETLSTQLAVLRQQGLAPILVVRDSVRSILSAALSNDVTDSVVLGQAEIRAHAHVRPTATVSWSTLG